MSDPIPPAPADDPGAIDDVNSSGSGTGLGSGAGHEDIPWAAVDSGQSDDIDNSLDAQGTADRETVDETVRDEDDERGDDGPRILS